MNDDTGIDKTIEDYNIKKEIEATEQEKIRLESLRQMEINKENERLKQLELEENQRQQEEKLNALSHTLGIPKINERLDELNVSQNEIIAKLTQVIQVLNQGIPQGQTVQAEAGQIDPIQKLEAVSGIFDKAVQLYTTFKQNQSPQAAPALIDQEFINKRMVESFMEDLDTGKSISTFIKNSLKKTATKNIVSTALKDIGHDDSNDPA